MGNITDDIRQHFDTFAELPFTEADSLALSQLAYARMPDNVPRYHENAETADGMIATVPIHDLLRAECYDDMFGKVWSPSMNVDLLRAMSESPRWRNRDDHAVGGLCILVIARHVIRHARIGQLGQSEAARNALQQTCIVIVSVIR